MILVLAMTLFGVDMIWVVFFGGIRLKAGDFVLRSTTIEFPTIALLISVFCFLLLKGKWKESILLVGSLLFASLIGEGILRFVDHPLSKPFIDQNAWQQPSKVLGFTMVPNFEGRGPLDVPIKTNAQGFRDDGEHSWTKPPGVIRILGLGDSFTFGWGVSLEETFLKKLEGRMRRLTGLKIETINAGVPIWDLNHYYVYYKEIGVRYAPDIVLLSYFFNDAPDIYRETLPPDNRYQQGVQHTGGIFRFSYLFNFFKSLARNIRRENRFKRFDHLSELGARRKKMTKPNNDMVFDPGPDQTQASTEIIKTLLNKIQSLASGHGGQLVMMYIPDVGQL
ncbi:MAG: SGNH/GDSL hydrolase family protein, partial [Nitrospirota bacterium]